MTTYYYSAEKEAIFSFDEPNFTPQYDNRNKLIRRDFSITVEIEYKSNPTDPETNRLSKDNSKLVQEKYDVKQTASEEDARRFFQQAVIRHIRADKEITASDAEVIRNQWKEAQTKP